MSKLKKIQIFNLHIISSPHHLIIKEILNDENEQITISYINAHTVNQLYQLNTFYLYKKIDYLISDGVGMNLATKLKSNDAYFMQGFTDFNNLFFKEASKKNLKVFVLGSQEDVLKDFRRYKNKYFSNLILVGSAHGYFPKVDDQKLIQKINQARPDLIIVGMGSPRQEEWTYRNHSKLSAKYILNVGAWIDFFAYPHTRAPKIVQKIGMEWFWRMCLEPKRLWKRYFFGIPKFLYRLFFLKT